MSDRINRSQRIKKIATELGFDACGICLAEKIDPAEKSHLEQWVDHALHGHMHYMANKLDKRCDPTLLVEGAKSIVCLALNYYPQVKQLPEMPQFAYYAYGKDYHDVMKERLNKLFNAIKVFIPNLEGRVFCDTAPILERYWAAKAGLGFIGKNSLLIIPQKGSYFFLCELILNVELEYDTPLTLSCGICNRCIEHCPTKAIVSPYVIDSNKCISYQTIENKGEIDQAIIPHLQNRFYGCDICQQVCPWNKFARPHHIPELIPSEALLRLSVELLENMTIEEYQRMFKGSAVKRAKFSGLKRNLEAIKSYRNNKSSDNSV